MASRNSELTATIKMGTSAVQWQDVGFFQQLCELGMGLQAPERSIAWLTSLLSLCETLHKGPREVMPELLAHRNFEIINIYYFKLLGL